MGDWHTVAAATVVGVASTAAGKRQLVVGGRCFGNVDVALGVESGGGGEVGGRSPEIVVGSGDFVVETFVVAASDVEDGAEFVAAVVAAVVELEGTKVVH